MSAEGSPLRELERSCRRIACSSAPVLITGETGTGKALFARLLHAESGRPGRLIPVHCAAIPESLLEPELFGRAPRAGRLAQAAGGTLLLDQVGALPPMLQGRLARVLQDGSFEPLGAEGAQPADFRLVATSDHDLQIDVAAGRFRKDLYYRLLVCELRVPPLRERRADVAPLLRSFLAARGELRPIDPSLFEALALHGWPGNVREVQNLAERIAVCATGPTLSAQDLPPAWCGLAPAPLPHPQPRAEASGGRPIALPADLPALLRDLEDTHIEAALLRAGGNKTVAAELLGLQRTTLVEKLRRKAR